MDIFREISPHLNAKISPRAKRLALRLDTRKRCMNLVIPKRVSLRAAYQFAFSHRDWIDDKLKLLPETIPYKDGVMLSLAGHDVTIRMIKDSDFKITKIELKNNELIIRTKLDDISPRLTRYLKDLAYKLFLPLCEEKAACIQKTVGHLSIKDMHTRWGSCSTDGRMTLSWRLIFAPREAFDYVIAHEVAHLKHANHGKHFWNLCEELSNDFEAGSDWMKQNGNHLLRFGG
jgi:predicted metal-dependent hydrolase